VAAVPDDTDQLRRLLEGAAAGQRPIPEEPLEVRGRVEGVEAVLVGLPHVRVISAPLPEPEVRAAVANRGGAAQLVERPAVVAWLTERLDAQASPCSVLLACTARPHAPDLAVHRREDRAPRGPGAARRDRVATFSDTAQRGVVAVGPGLAGRREVTVHVDPEHRGQGVARGLVAAALRVLGVREPAFAAVPASDAAALRALQAVGFVPLGAEVVLTRR